jgi:DNA repair exonuclease SbcCD ATPase subunit
MPLEETIASLKSQRESLLDATKIYKEALEDYRSDQEKELIERTIEDLTKRIAALTSALHHLEAGKRDAERLEQIHQLAVYPADCATDLNCDPDREFKLRERIADLSFSTPTTEPQT